MKRNIAIILFKDVEELDFVGPWEVFRVFATGHADLCEVFTVSEKGGEVRCAKGLRVIADYSFESAPPAQIILVPGGQGRKREVDNPPMIEFIRRCAQSAELVTSVCTGAFILHRAGLLDGKRATTYWNARDELGGLGVNVIAERFVEDGKIITASGVSAGIDMSLHVIGKLWGPPVARSIQKWIEYFPEPPYQDVPIPG